MHSTLKTIVLISLGVATAQALAGPDWGVINRVIWPLTSSLEPG